MILGRPTPCFQEIDEAVAQLQAARGDDRPVVFNWQAGEVPRGAIIYNFDFPGIHFGFPQMRSAAARASEVWDFSKAGAAAWRVVGVNAICVPVGYHPSMSRFERVLPEVDVVFVGCVNDRRRAILESLRKRLVVAVAPQDRKLRDEMLARCRASINMLFYPTGAYPMLRAAHLLANDIPYVGERSPECEADPTSGDFVEYEQLAEDVCDLIENKESGRRKEFMAMPMILPGGG